MGEMPMLLTLAPDLTGKHRAMMIPEKRLGSRINDSTAWVEEVQSPTRV